MFNSYKIVTVSDSQFELIGRGCISAVIVNDPVLPEIQKTEHFIIAHGDAAMIARVDRHYPSTITGRVVVEFNLVQPQNPKPKPKPKPKHGEFFITELSAEQLK